MERGAWMEYWKLFSTADIICEDKDSLTWAHILNSASLVESEKGNTSRARPYIEEAMRIRQRLCPPDDMDLSDVYNNFGFMLLTESQSQQSMAEAEKYFKMAIEIDEKVPEGHQVLHVRYLNLGKVLCVKGDFDEAERCYEIGKEHSERTFGKSTHFVGR
jgi:tetratricopeptide (TPR) repeat protein